MRQQSKGYVLFSGLLILTLMGWFGFSAWNTSQLTVKTAINYQQKRVAKEAAHIALRLSEGKLKSYLAEMRFLKPERLLHNPPGFINMEPRLIVWNKRLSKLTPVSIAIPGYRRGPCYSIDYLGGRDKVFVFRIVASGWSSDGQTEQVLMAFYHFVVTEQDVQGRRSALYVF